MGKSGYFMFLGEYHYAIDEKNRLTIPSKLRFDLGEQFILTRGLDNCLFLYPMKEWNLIIEKYKTLPNTKDARNFMRFLLSGASICELDKQGRINISTPLKNYAQLEKECVIIGVSERLEIWNEQKWNEFIKNNENNFSEIADNLFSNF